MEGQLRHREKSWRDHRGGGEGRAGAVLGPACENGGLSLPSRGGRERVHRFLREGTSCSC